MMDRDSCRCSPYRLASGGRDWSISRRVFLKSTAACVAGLAVSGISCSWRVGSRPRSGPVRFGMVTDCHYADSDTRGTRFYRESLAKLAECVGLMNSEGVDFVIELGDLKDQNRPPVEQKTLSYLEAVEEVFQRFEGPTYHVLGNHEMDSISKGQCLARVENTGIKRGRSYYSFDLNGLHFIVLDANYKADGSDYDHGNFEWTDTNIPSEQLDWLNKDLAAVGGPVVVFIHQLLDGVGPVYVNNAADVRQILEASGKVLAVLQGHHHAGGYTNIAGIHYYTLKALVEGSGAANNSYAIADVRSDGSITITGYRKAVSRRLAYSHAVANV
jgi:predicted phosphodiesterase